MNIPNWYELVLLGLAAFRTWKLVGEDTILDRPRNWAVKHGGEYVETLLLCAWCSGAWISIYWWIAFQFWPHAVVAVAVPFAISAIVGLLGYFSSD